MIVIIIGTKAELIKTASLMLELEKQNKEYLFVNTGQHNLTKECKDFGIRMPDVILSEEPKKGTKFMSNINQLSIVWSFSMILKIRRLLKRIKNVTFVLVHSDTMSTVVAAIAASSLLNPEKKWKIVHLESGLRSESLKEPFPEEIARIIGDKFSDILIAVSERAENNLKKEKLHGRIHLFGNIAIDSTLATFERTKKRYKRIKGKYALVNIHRHENLRSRKRMAKIVSIVLKIPIKTYWPLHDGTRHYLEKYGLLNIIKNNKNIILSDLVSYSEFTHMLAHSEMLLVDGGSIQEESLIFKKPCLLLRMKTERQEGLGTGINFLTELNVEKTKKIMDYILNRKFKIPKVNNPYGGKGASKRVADILF
jgi:UDP-N-acetylglucosamine 2-epimerase (non-hydrolysing)